MDTAPKPLTEAEAQRIRVRSADILGYLQRAMELRGHDERHTFYRLVVEAIDVMQRLDIASPYVSGMGAFSVSGGSLTTESIPPARKAT